MADCELPPPPPPDLKSTIQIARKGQPIDQETHEFLIELLQLCRDHKVSLKRNNIQPLNLVEWNLEDEAWLAQVQSKK